MTKQLAELLVTFPFGFMTEEQAKQVEAVDRLCPVLVRCGGCRFTCGVQYLSHLIECIEKNGDYVRDVSITAQEMECARRIVGLVPA